MLGQVQFLKEWIAAALLIFVTFSKGQVKNTFAVIGCYRDCGPNVLRDLNGQGFNDNGLTLQRCADLCIGQGFRYAGAQFNFNCFCGNSYGTNGPHNSTIGVICDYRCWGDATEICGGYCANTVLDTIGVRPTLPSYYIKGCFKDLETLHDLPYLALNTSILTFNLCLDTCLLLGYRYAGLQEGNLCYCGQTYNASGPSTVCGTLCSGDVTTICGGTLANTVLDNGLIQRQEENAMLLNKKYSDAYMVGRVLASDVTPPGYRPTSAAVRCAQRCLAFPACTALNVRALNGTLLCELLALGYWKLSAITPEPGSSHWAEG